jgi:hypothetical protein
VLIKFFEFTDKPNYGHHPEHTYHNLETRYLKLSQEKESLNARVNELDAALFKTRKNLLFSRLTPSKHKTERPYSSYAQQNRDGIEVLSTTKHREL